MNGFERRHRTLHTALGPARAGAGLLRGRGLTRLLAVSLLSASLLRAGAARAEPQSAWATSPGALLLEPHAMAASSNSAALWPAADASPTLRFWGWLLIATSVSLGASALSYGLTLSCDEQDEPCERRAGLAIWGGVGIASLGSIAGFTLLYWPSGDGSNQVGVALRLNAAVAPLAQLHSRVSEAQWPSIARTPWEPGLSLRLTGW